MIELTFENIYRVKNFAKHQNIKVKEKIEATHKENYVKIKEAQVKDEIHVNKDKQSENKIIQNDVENPISHEIGKLEINNKYINKSENKISDEIINNTSQNIISMPLGKEKNKNKKKDNNIKEENEGNTTVWFYEGEGVRPLAKGESVTREWSCV